MDFIDKQYSRHDFSAAFFSPFSNFLVDLLTNFWFNLTNVTCEKSHEALTAGVDNIDFVESDSVYYLFPLL